MRVGGVVGGLGEGGGGGGGEWAEVVCLVSGVWCLCVYVWCV